MSFVPFYVKDTLTWANTAWQEMWRGNNFRCDKRPDDVQRQVTWAPLTSLLRLKTSRLWMKYLNDESQLWLALVACLALCTYWINYVFEIWQFALLYLEFLLEEADCKVDRLVVRERCNQGVLLLASPRRLPETRVPHPHTKPMSQVKHEGPGASADQIQSKPEFKNNNTYLDIDFQGNYGTMY